MLLAIDAGNTNTVIGLYDGLTLLTPWRVATNVERTSDELALLVMQFLAQHDVEFDEHIEGVCVSSGVPRLTAALREMTARYAKQARLVVLEPGTKSGMPILITEPRELGSDRLANAVGAYDLYGGPSVIVDFGTANSVDAVSAAGEYLGGAIFPGIEISLDALFARAAALRRVELIEPRNVIGKGTVEAIQSGAIYGFVAQTDGLVHRFLDELGDATVIATGGLSGPIVRLSQTIQHHEPWLTLHGLRIIYERNLT